MATMVTVGPMAAFGHRRGRGGQGSVRTAAAPAPVRLTRRGRMLVTGVSALVIGAASVALASAAQAAHEGAASPGRYAARVEVMPGQSLWSLAVADDPHADPRVITQEIIQLNALTGDQVQAGEMLWVPRG